MDFFEAYHLRMKNAWEKLMGLAKELKEKHGCDIYVSGDLLYGGTLVFFEARMEGRKTTVGFTDVPYRWYVGNSVNGKVFYLKGKDGYDLPIKCEDVINNMVACNNDLPRFLIKI